MIMNLFKSAGVRVILMLVLVFGLFAVAPVRADSIIHYVKWDATGSNNGTSWTDAYTDLQLALASASSGDEIWVAAGTYKPTSGTNRSISFNLKNGVAVYGGFAGTETLLSQRDFQTNVTILSGDIGVVGNTSDNSYHVMVGSNTGNSSVLDGFTITGGNIPGGGYDFGGGGIYNSSGSPTLRNLRIHENIGGIGSGVYNYKSNPIFENVIFSNNAGGLGSRGGALVNDVDSSPSLTNVTFFNNSVDLLGAAVTNTYNSNPYLVNVTFAGNYVYNLSSSSGGAIYNWNSNPTIINATFTGNSALAGGAIYNGSNSHTTIINSILYGNLGGEIYNASGSSSVSYSIIQGGYSGTGNIDANPLLGPLQDNGGFTQTMALLPGSPAIDAGDDATCTDTDQRGMARPQGSHCDMGAFEYVFPPAPTATPTFTDIPTHTPTSTPTDTPTATPTATSTVTPTLTPTLGFIAKPGVPVLISPVNSALVINLQPVFDWKDSNPVAHHYHIQVATSSNFGVLVIDDSGAVSSTFTPNAELLPGKLYYWRIRAFNAIGAASAWSSVRNFKTPLAQPTLVSPANDETLVTDRPAFNWDETPGATRYILQVSSVNNFSSLLVNVTVNTPAYTMTKDFPQNKTLYWRVQAKTSVVSSPWSVTWSFKTGNPPSVPGLSSPSNGSLAKTYAPTFNWKDSTVPAGTVFKHYQIQVDDTPGFTSTVIDTTTIVSDFTPLADLASNTKFYWRVRTFNSFDGSEHYSGWSSVWSLRTVILEPQSLTMIPNGNNSLQPSFTWDTAAGQGAITSYTVQISTNASFSALLLNSTVKDPMYALTRNLPPGKTIYVRVMVNGTNGPSAWSILQFVTP